MRALIRLILSTIAIFVTSFVVPDVYIENITTAAIVAIILGVLNMFLKPILVLLTLPITIVSLGLFYFVINTFLIILTAAIIPGFSINSIWGAILFSLIFSIINTFLNKLAN